MFSFEDWRLLLWLGRHFFDEKNIIFLKLYFFQFFVIKTLDKDPETESLKMLDPDPQH
jgi:hypothetical protein